jgi:GGDEF domain-containing protein
VILLSNVDDRILDHLAGRIQRAPVKPMDMHSQPIKVSASIGWSYTTYVAQGDLEVLIREADGAMYMAKGRGNRELALSSQT